MKYLALFFLNFFRKLLKIVRVPNLSNKAAHRYTQKRGCAQGSENFEF